MPKPPNPPPKKNHPPPLARKSPAPRVSGACRAGLISWCAHALQEGFAGDEPLFVCGTHARMTLEWVFRRLERCRIRRHGERKGTLR